MLGLLHQPGFIGYLGYAVCVCVCIGRGGICSVFRGKSDVFGAVERNRSSSSSSAHALPNSDGSCS